MIVKSPLRLSVVAVAVALSITGAALLWMGNIFERTIATNSTNQEFSPCRERTEVNDFQCHKRKYAEYTRFAGPGVALTAMEKEHAVNPFVASQCHQLTHEVGHEAVGYYGSITEAFKHGNSFCWSGYYHGVVEEMIATKGRDAVLSGLNTFCAEIPGKDRYSFDYYNCVHGLGHGVMAMTRNDLRESLRVCQTLAGSWEQESCYGGVFMENVMADLRDHGKADLKTDDLLYPCNSVDHPYKNQCYLMQTSYMLSRNSYDFQNVFALCERADQGFVPTCYQSAGRDASGSTMSDPTRAEAICRLAPTREGYDNCLIGAVKDFISYHHGDKEARVFCNSTKDKAASDLCHRTADAYLVIM